MDQTTARIRLLVNDATAPPAFQAAVAMALETPATNFEFGGLVFEVHKTGAIALVTTVLTGLTETLPSLFDGGELELLMTEISADAPPNLLASPGWYILDPGVTTMYVDPSSAEGPGLLCSSIGDGIACYRRAIDFYHAVLSGALTPELLLLGLRKLWGRLVELA